ncbi:MAG TPA: nucleotidyltransferase family protein [Gammaproteobacteria bacterium]
MNREVALLVSHAVSDITQTAAGPAHVKAMILAAGRGERMRELTDDRPKPLLRIGGETLIARHLRRLHEAGIEDVVINLSYRGEQIRNTLGSESDWGQRLSYSDEGEPPLETAGGIIAALPLLGPEPFLVVSADVYTDFDLARLDLDTAEGVLMLVANPEHHSQGDFGLSADGILTFEQPLQTFGGIAVLSPPIFEGWAPGRRPLRPVLEAAIRRGVLRGVFHDGVWSDVGTPERLAELERRVL